MDSDPARSMRFTGGLAAVVFAIAVPLMLGLLVAQDSDRTPRALIGLLVVGVPVNLAGIYFAVRAMADNRPETASRRLGVAWGVIAVGMLIMLGGNALLRL
jgi:hypothetical protein